ncbi:unnamed protein product [Clonostachys byssicola]|uniref:Heterokaryon incompatibility domain-containing protein n=1 Tax=Clonostachys byssicola TaxID=160290 RepID=A0A9N9UBB2_9HYPO|nr:unnamed protein product [Clonostachys byssicola]
MSESIVLHRDSPSYLCKRCIGFFSTPKTLSQNDDDLNLHSSSTVEVLEAEQAGCAFCTHIVQQLEDADDDYDFRLAFTIREGPSNQEKPVWALSANLANTELGKPINYALVPIEQVWWSLRFGGQDIGSNNKYGIGSSTDSTLSRNIVQKWHMDCLQGHQTCQINHETRGWVPTRLIEINETSFRVITNQGHHSDAVTYVALSHCWGESEIIKLTTATANSLFTGAPISKLPRTFRDAIEVCRWLNYSHIWIDALCIIQDSDEDWKTEAHAMAEVYGRAALTIAAAHGKDAMEGLFAARRPEAIKAPIIECSWGADKSAQRYCLVDERLWRNHVDLCHLSKRAWTVQERFLSPRTLYFTQHQVFYRCATHDVCESFPADNTPAQLFDETSLPSPRSAMKPRDIWARAASIYSSAALTKDTDKVIAIAGLAASLGVRMQDEYLVGLWRSNLVHELLWRSSGDDGAQSRPNPCRAPSWSWMAVKGVGVKINENVCSARCKHLVEIIFASVDLVDSTCPTGDIHGNSGILQLRGCLKPAAWSPIHKYTDADWRKYQVTFPGQDQAEVGDGFESTVTRPDYIDPSLMDLEIYLLPMVSIPNQHKTECLLLAPVCKETQSYQRIGLCAVSHVGGMNRNLFKERRYDAATRVSIGWGRAVIGNDGWENLPISDICIL